MQQLCHVTRWNLGRACAFQFSTLCGACTMAAPGASISSVVLGLLVCLCGVPAAFGGRGAGAKPRLQFSEAGTFKLVQFADLHFGEGEAVAWGPQQDLESKKVMAGVLAVEKPQLVVLSGDQLTGLNIKSNATSYWDEIVDVIEAAAVPHTAILGNHDAEPHSGAGSQSSPGALTNRTQLIRHDMSRTLSLTELGPPNLEPAVSVYVKDVWPPASHATASESGDQSVPAMQIVHMDSGGGGMVEEVFPEQISWFNRTMQARRSEFGRLVPALVFVHIPLHEFEDALEGGKCFGTRDDGITPTIVNNGLFSAIDATPEVHGVFVGHDHCNDWCCSFGERAVSLCFARHSGGGGYGCDGYNLGARVIEVSITPSLQIDTHIRMANGSTIHAGTLD